MITFAPSPSVASHERRFVANQDYAADDERIVLENHKQPEPQIARRLKFEG